MRHINIAFILPSAIECAGLASIIDKMKDVPTTIHRYTGLNALSGITTLNPSIIIMDPVMTGAVPVEELRTLTGRSVKIILMTHHPLPDDIIREFDGSISIYDTPATIETTIRNLVSDEVEEDTKTLSQREKEVVVGIVKGQSNKEIAEEMGVSVNTVMTHRRNIASKLQIHSAAGLTIYAIVSKLVKLEDIQTRLPK